VGKKSSSEKLVIAAASAGAAVGAAYLAVGNAIFNKTMSKKSIAKKMDEKKNEYDGITKEGMEWFDSASPAKVKIVTPRGGYVHGEIILADEPSDVWVIVIHGYTGSPRRMGSFGKRFHEMGYNCLFPYLCGHGASESNYVAMGWNDRIDIKAWIDYIINENANAKIVLFGLSMGAATVMMTTGEPLDKAGAYGIQGPAAVFVKRVEGCYFTIIGMPMHKLYHMLAKVGIYPDWQRAART